MKGQVAVTDKGQAEIASKEIAKLPDYVVKQLHAKKYAVVGNHSAVQVCTYNKKTFKGAEPCYKEKFYGIDCHRCAQMSPAAMWCNENCVFCWRPMEFMKDVNLDNKIVDEPRDIIDGVIKSRKKLLSGFGGLPGLHEQKFKEAQLPSHWAVSLSGEPTMYPKICELIVEIKRLPDTKSVFLVTNAQLPQVFEKMASNEDFLPTQLYVSLDAPNEALFKKINRSVFKDGWERLNKSLEVIGKLKVRRVIRFTIIRGLNDMPEMAADWAKIIRKANPEFLEIKSYMHIGMSRQRLNRENMLLHPEVKAFAEKIAEASGYKYSNESVLGRIVLLVRPDLEGKSTKIVFNSA
ncbi:MAG: 4-demethylwyosine synthase TYW1 [Candidatus Diapherotrites archaeon]|uniref:S-adenosyl-L-methionine-dependent tRNA 4-demethylwyosine synthase n=1 Tax=Candidatus Iainarchaeum sp. TaxID=3101447 RepID=A0A7J4IUG0_9ARCH|nr:MAG: tRNA-modifying protein [archaeon GW2011_AR10]MBS3059272.1 4-demethylwyosine synthase TYW1 [Candidatus Diapherotrites archaeon]HIH08424.1 4-demethylwyosine synthase TYW1 [Candidatus Diapherotrites archaeon]